MVCGQGNWEKGHLHSKMHRRRGLEWSGVFCTKKGGLHVFGPAKE